MAPAKRKAASNDDTAAPAAKKSRVSKVTETTASSTRPKRQVATATANSDTRSTRSATVGRPANSTKDSSSKTPAKVNKKTTGTSATTKPSTPAKKAVGRPKSTKSETKASTPAKKSVGRPKSSKPKTKAAKAAEETSNEQDDEGEDETATQRNDHQSDLLSVEIPVMRQGREASGEEDEEDFRRPFYWLMKAEPESRIEKGKDVKFSIDDLEAAEEPELWDGVRNAVACNNMKTMEPGDLAFFYHSNCKVPGIVGIMEIIEGHSVDESAFDPEHPYYDAKSNRENPKWCVVHVEFREKFREMVKLKELQKFGRDGGVLENLQTLKQSRLSVSRVMKKEWDFILDFVDDR